MKKTLIALAALGMIAGTAQATNVTVYGKLQPSIDIVDAGDTSGDYGAGDVTDMTWNNSRIGFKGSEDLGNGLKAIFQIESKVKLTEGETDGFAGRDSWVGLAGDFGSVTFGKHQSAYVKSSAKYDVFADSIGDYNNIMGSFAYTDGTFNSRIAKSIYYKSPCFNGFKVQASYALGSQQNDQVDDADVTSLAVNYNNGPFMAVLAYEEQDNGGWLSGHDVDAWKLGLGYKADFGTQFTAIYEKLSSDAWSGFDRDNMFIAAKHAVSSNVDVAGSLAVARDMDGIDESGAKALSLGVTYKLSKRTSILGVYSKINNDENAAYGYDSGVNNTGYDGSTGLMILPGEDVSGISVRLQHKF